MTRTTSLALAVLVSLAAAAAAQQPAKKPPALDTSRSLTKQLADSTRPKIKGRDPLWWEGHAYRHWIHEQNKLADDNPKLDSMIQFTAGGKVRMHPNRVWFYNDADKAMDLALETRMPVVFHLFDHDCQDCLFQLPVLYADPDVVAASRDFINCYVQIGSDQGAIKRWNMLDANLTVQFYLPSGRQLRAMDRPDKKQLLEMYGIAKRYVASLSPEELVGDRLVAKEDAAAVEKTGKPVKSGY